MKCPVAVLVLLLFVACAIGVDLIVSRDGDMVRVSTTNNTYRCAMFQWNSTLASNGWSDYHGYWAGAQYHPVKTLVFTVNANDQMVFWRLRDCATP